jgi:hypothetical protein
MSLTLPQQPFEKGPHNKAYQRDPVSSSHTVGLPAFYTRWRNEETLALHTTVAAAGSRAQGKEGQDGAKPVLCL